MRRLTGILSVMLLARAASAQPGKQDPPPLPPPAEQPPPAPPPAAQPQPLEPAPAPAAAQPAGPPPHYPPPPGYGPAPGYGGYGYGPPVAPIPPPPPRKPPPTCCRFALRVDPIELLIGRLTFQGEFAIAGPVAIEIEPSWIWGTLAEETDEKGLSIAGNLGVYFGQQKLRGFWLKGHFAYEAFEATLTAPDGATQVSADVASPVFGVMLGSNLIFGPDRGRDGGFVLSMGGGVGVAAGERVVLTTTSQDGRYESEARYYDGVGRVRVLGTIALGATF